MITFQFIADGTVKVLQCSFPQEDTDSPHPDKNHIIQMGKSGYASLIETVCKDACFWFLDLHAKRSMLLHTTADIPLLDLYVCLSGTFSYFIQGIGNIPFSEKEYNLLFGEDLVINAPFTNGRYEMVDIRFKQAYLAKWCDHIPLLNKFLDKQYTGHAGKLFHPNRMACDNILTTIRQIQSCEYRDDLRTLFLEGKCLELLLLAFSRELINDTDNFIFKKRDKDKVISVKDYLLKHYDQPCTCEELARVGGINEWMLRKLFKLLFGMPVYEFLLTLRMEKAKELLRSGEKSVKEIALETGYSNHSNFSNAFKKHFGYPPGQLRK